MNNTKAFTLIELLVVILIIGILAAVALPQYQKAVEKSRAAQAISLVKSVAQAQQAYYLANGTYATGFDELAVEIPWKGTSKWNAAATTYDVRSNADWSLQLYHDSSEQNIAVSVGRLTGKYKGTGFMIFIKHTAPTAIDTLLCAERFEGGYLNFGGSKGDYCEKLFHATYMPGTGATTILSLFRM